MLFVCVLFIGNSLTFANDLPGMVRALVDSSVYLPAGEAWEAAPGGFPRACGPSPALTWMFHPPSPACSRKRQPTPTSVTHPEQEDLPMRASRFALALSLVAVAAGCAPKDKAPAGPRIETREVTYNAGPTTMKGFVAWDAAAAGKRPGVVIVHEWWGLNDNIKDQARRLAAEGYVAFAADMFGEGKMTSHPPDAATFAGEASKDPAVMVARFNAALDALKADPNVDPERIGAIGYCFGGMVVLSMARAGADLDAVSSFHGALPQGPVDSGTVKAHVLVATGGADSFVPAASVESFTKSMEKAGAAVHVVTYPGAKHGFTNPNAASYGLEQLAYDQTADTASWNAMRSLFKEVWP